MPPIERAEGWARSADGTALSWPSWRSPSPRAGAAIVHGLGEHSGRYDHVGRFLAERGIDSWAGDCRGHGRVEWPGFYHEMLNEIGRERVLDRVAEWLTARLD